MKALMIKDLSASTELDDKAMAAVAGGTSYFPHLPLWGAPSYSSSYERVDTKSVIANQDLAQVMDVEVATGINAAFVSDIESNVYSDQHASNNINIS